MRLSSVRIKNLRAFCDDTLPLDGYACLVGANGSGKSTILTALNIFFRENTNSVNDLRNLVREDFHAGDTSKPVKITLTFVDLNDHAKQDFAAYYRHDKLVISAEAQWNENTQCAEVKQIGERMGIEEFREFYDGIAAKKKKAELEPIFLKLAKQYGFPAKYTSQAAAEEALHKYESENPAKCKPIPSPTEFYGYTGGEYLLNKYIQWVYVPAVKDASEEEGEGKDTCLTKLLERAVTGKLTFGQDLSALRDKMQIEYDAIVQNNQVHLDGLSTSLGSRLQEWSHPDTRMHVRFAPNDKSLQVTKPPAKITAGEGVFDGAISRFGHGLQRCFLLAILQELAATDAAAAPRLLLGIEEPELYQHPPQARHLANVLIELTKKNSQVVVSTHSPLFVSGQYFESVRLIRRRAVKYDACATWIDVKKLTDVLNAARGGNWDKPATTIAKINQLLQPSLNEMFFAPVIIFVEGLEDLAFIVSYLALTDRMRDFRRLGCHIVPTNGKDSLAQPIAIAKQLQIPCLAVFDSDAMVTKPEWLEMNKRDNSTILHVMGYAGEDPLPKAAVWKKDLVIWQSDIGDAIATDIGVEKWKKVREEVKKKYNLHAKGDMTKNGILIGHMLAEAIGAGDKFPTLDKLVTVIMQFAAEVTGKPQTVPSSTAPAKPREAVKLTEAVK